MKADIACIKAGQARCSDSGQSTYPLWASEAHVRGQDKHLLKHS